MKYIFSLIILAALTLMPVSCKKFNPFENRKPTMNYVSGDDKDKIDLKGSLMKPDMRYINIYAELVGEIVYVYFNEPVENCGVTLTTQTGDVLYSRRVAKQQPATLRIFMGNESTGDYKLYITNGVEDASGWFHYENTSEINLSTNNKTIQK